MMTFRAEILDYASCKGYDSVREALENVRGDDYAPYYHEIDELYATYEQEFWELLETYQDDCIGGGSILTTLDNMAWGYTKGPITCLQDLKQWVVWFAIENVAHDMARELEEKETEVSE